MNNKKIIEFLEKNTSFENDLVEKFKKEIIQEGNNRVTYTVYKFSVGDQVVKLDSYEDVSELYYIADRKKGVYLLYHYDKDLNRHYSLETEEDLQNDYLYFNLYEFAEGKYSSFLNISIIKTATRKQYTYKTRHVRKDKFMNFDLPHELKDIIVTFNDEGITERPLVIKDFKRGFFLLETLNGGFCYMLSAKYVEKYSLLFKDRKKFRILNY